MRKNYKNLLTYSFLASLMLMAACKKNEDTVLTTATSTADVRDSVYIISQDLYLWSNTLPTLATFKPTSYPTADSVMRKLRTYSPFVNAKYQDRWSFAIDKSTWDNYSQGNSSDVGLEYGFISETDLRIKLVYSQSPAGLQGVKRGWKVVKINGVAATIANIDQLNTELNKATQTMVFSRPDGVEQTMTLTVGAYKSDYVMNPKVFSVNGNNVGYFAFDSFLGDAINGKTAQTTLNALDLLFTDFKAKNVTELVLDLRYNGGGYGLVSNYLGNLIAPASAVGKVFSKTEHNTKYSQYNATTYFQNSTNGLKLSKITIIVNKGTASASEELINGLKPVMNVKLIGNTTHGKPVGYYAIPTMNYYAFPVALKNVNSAGTGDFYEGFSVDKVQSDDIRYELGDANEACLKSALDYIKTGVLQSVPQATRLSAVVEQSNTKITKDRLKMTVYDFPRTIK